MGLYTRDIPPFEDLRKHDLVKRRGKPPARYGVEPRYANDVDKVVQHLLALRKASSASGRGRIGPRWRREIQNLLRGTTSSGVKFTADQLCDLLDYAQQDDFWRPYVQDTAGLVRHAHKLWLKPEFSSWSKRNKRPPENRPDSKLVQNANGNRLKWGAGEKFRGELAADQKHDPSEWEGEL